MQLIEPLTYAEFAQVLSLAEVVLTDSGGVQEEAPSLGKPVLVMHENTERPEAVVAGTVKLIGTHKQRLVDEVSLLLDSEEVYAGMANAVNPYGDGFAAERTVAAIRWKFCDGDRPADFGQRLAILVHESCYLREKYITVIKIVRDLSAPVCADWKIKCMPS